MTHCVSLIHQTLCDSAVEYERTDGDADQPASDAFQLNDRSDRLLCLVLYFLVDLLNVSEYEGQAVRMLGSIGRRTRYIDDNSIGSIYISELSSWLSTFPVILQHS